MGYRFHRRSDTMHDAEVICRNFSPGAHREDVRLEACTSGCDAMRANVTLVPAWIERVCSRDQDYGLGQVFSTCEQSVWKVCRIRPVS
jgi:hypothetical protein